MLETFKELLANQYEAAFCTLNGCIDTCSDDAWDSRVVNYIFCQAVFHTLFYADYYLGQNKETLRDQPFHRDNERLFGEYEELKDQAPQARYDKTFIRNYLQHCRTKASEVIASETAESFRARAGFERREFSRAELHVYNIRHIQHHAAQLSLRLRIDTGTGIPWVGSEWREMGLLQ